MSREPVDGVDEPGPVEPVSRRPIAALLVLATFAVGAGIASIEGTAIVVYVPYAAVGAILVIRRPGNPIGWLLTAIAWTFALAWLPVDATPEALASLTAPPVVLSVAWFKWWWSLPLTFTLVAALAVTFPTGHLPRSRGRRPARLLLAAMAGLTAVAALWPAQVVAPGDGAASFWMPNPLPLVPAGSPAAATGTLSAALVPVILAMLLVACVSLLARFRAASGIERLQLRWLVAGLGAIVLAIPFGFLLFAIFGSGFALTWAPATVAFALPPIAIGIAVTRYRLYEIDRIVSRGIAWVLLSVLLLTVYAGGILALQGLLGEMTQGDTLAVAASTLLAAALFQPLRRRIQRATDHRFDRARYDGERTATAFADRLRGQVDLTGLEADVARTVHGALRPSSMTVWIRAAGRGAAR